MDETFTEEEYSLDEERDRANHRSMTQLTKSFTFRSNFHISENPLKINGRESDLVTL